MKRKDVIIRQTSDPWGQRLFVVSAVLQCHFSENCLVVPTITSTETLRLCQWTSCLEMVWTIVKSNETWSNILHSWSGANRFYQIDELAFPQTNFQYTPAPQMPEQLRTTRLLRSVVRYGPWWTSGPSTNKTANIQTRKIVSGEFLANGSNQSPVEAIEHWMELRCSVLSTFSRNSPFLEWIKNR